MSDRLKQLCDSLTTRFRSKRGRDDYVVMVNGAEAQEIASGVNDLLTQLAAREGSGTGIDAAEVKK